MLTHYRTATRWQFSEIAVQIRSSTKHALGPSCLIFKLWRQWRPNKMFYASISTTLNQSKNSDGTLRDVFALVAASCLVCCGARGRFFKQAICLSARAIYSYWIRISLCPVGAIIASQTRHQVDILWKYATRTAK